MCVCVLVVEDGGGGGGGGGTGGGRCLRPCFDVGPIVLNPNKIVIKSYLFFCIKYVYI